MTRKLNLTARQVTALCKGAARAGYVPIVKIGDISIHLVPQDDAHVCGTTTTELDDELEEWERTVRDRLLRPILDVKSVLSRSDKEFRHSVETADQRATRHAKVQAQWKADLLCSELDHREHRAMSQLASRPDEPQHISTIAGAGSVTAHRLALRGFIEFTSSEKPPGATDIIALTPKGRKAFDELERMRGRRGYL